MTDETHPDDLPEPPDPATRAEPRGGVPFRSLVGAGAAVLVVNGILLFTLAAGPLLDPASTRCALARDRIEQAEESDEEFDDVDLGDDDVDDISCDEAIAAADTIRVDEDSDDTVSLPSDGGIRTEAVIAGVLGLGQVVGGALVLRAGRRWHRNLAAAFAAGGILFPIIGLASLLIVGFVVFALVFSNPARALWPRGR